MFKKARYGLAILSLALSFFTSTAMAANCLLGHASNDLKTTICDVSFTADPTFANMCLLTTQTGIYTITNNTPVAIRINYIRILSNDALPAAASAVVAAPTNSCSVGNSLAPGASCNIGVNLIPLAVGVYNRFLQIGINTRQVEIDSPLITPTILGCLPPGPTPPPGPFFPGGFDFTILAGSTVTNVGPTAVNGNVGVSPGTSITGFPPGTVVNGALFPGGATPATAQGELTTAYNNLVAAPCGTNLSGQDLGPAGGRTLAPGVYCFDTTAQLTGALTLSGAGVYVFQIGTSLTTGTGASVTLINGATNANVYWQVGSSATLGLNTSFQGNIVALTSITLNTGVSLLGRALARNGAVTLDTNAVNPS